MNKEVGMFIEIEQMNLWSVRITSIPRVHLTLSQKEIQRNTDRCFVETKVSLPLPNHLNYVVVWDVDAGFSPWFSTTRSKLFLSRGFPLSQAVVVVIHSVSW